MASRRPPVPRPRVDSAAAEAALDAVYAELPDVRCAGKCSGACGPVPMTELERDRIAAAGVRIPARVQRRGPGALNCPALNAFQRCSVYEVRPTMCRLWGVTQSLPCVFGCRPLFGELLSDQAAYAFIARVNRIADGRG
jgi:hypothetical protein